MGDSAEEIEQREAQFRKAFLKMQTELRGAVRDSKNDHFKSKYADLEAVWDACRKPLQDNGFYVTQLPVGGVSPDHLGLETELVHEPTGCSIAFTSQIPLPKKDPQAFGSALTYARRYTLMSAIGLCPVDDDGEAATGRGKSTAASPKPAQPAGLSELEAEARKLVAKNDAAGLQVLAVRIRAEKGEVGKELADRLDEKVKKMQLEAKK